MYFYTEHQGEIISNPKVYQELLTYGGGRDLVDDYLSKHNPVIVKDSSGLVYGMFDVTFIDETCVEVHTYILKDRRSRSKAILQGFVDVLFSSPQINCICTSVEHEFKYVVRFLKTLGFKVTGEDSSATYLSLFKESKE